jgi:2-iminoacetate synthase
VSSAPGRFAAQLASLDLPALANAPATEHEVRAALSAEQPSLTQLAALLSPTAEGMLEEIAQAAAERTLQRFGRAVRLFAPLYISNACLSSCTYCGFAKGLDVARRTLTPDEVEAEARLLADRGFRSLLLVAGEHRIEVSPDYVIEVVERVARIVPQVAVETQTWSDDTYSRLVAAGCEGVVHYQETYDRERYAQTHVAGWKRDFDRRLSSTERAAESGVRRLGIGALLGLAPDWRAEVLAVAAHARFLVSTYWRTEVTVALPRITPSASGFQPSAEVDERRFVLGLCALRLYEPLAGIVVSTRERPAVRDGLIRICATHMSAGSSTEPGGYSSPGTAQEQFAVTDERNPDEVAAAIAALGYEPVWKDAFPLTAAAQATRI